MLANFKKFGVTAAVAAALGASGAAHAVVEGEPGGALLIPLVYTATAATGTVTNTLIGVTVAGLNHVNVAQFAHTGPTSAAGTPAGTLFAGATDALGCGRSDAELHWYFFDVESIEVVDDRIPVTCEDFVRIDWNHVVDVKSLPSAKNKLGYMVITDAASNATTPSNMALYATAYLIQGNWASMAYIPAVPLYDNVDTAAGDEVIHTTAFVDVIPASAGLLLPSTGTVAVGNDVALFSMRYFLDPALKAATTFVLWFPENSDLRDPQGIQVYDAAERPISAVTSIPNELNVVAVAPDATTSGLVTAVIRDGLFHRNPDDSSDTALGDAVNTGFVVFNVRDFDPAVSAVTEVERSRGGFAFSLIGINGAVSDQLQTELAHERGIQ